MFGGLLEFFLANTFPSIVFMIYGMHLPRGGLEYPLIEQGGIFFAFAATLNPYYSSATFYSTNGSYSEGFLTAGFNASLGKTYCTTVVDPFTLANVLFLGKHSSQYA